MRYDESFSDEVNKLRHHEMSPLHSGGRKKILGIERSYLKHVKRLDKIAGDVWFCCFNDRFYIEEIGDYPVRWKMSIAETTEFFDLCMNKKANRANFRMTDEEKTIEKRGRKSKKFFKKIILDICDEHKGFKTSMIPTAAKCYLSKLLKELSEEGILYGVTYGHGKIWLRH